MGSQFFYRRRTYINTGPSGNRIEDNGDIHRIRYFLVVFHKSFLRTFIIIGRNHQKTVRAYVFQLLRHKQGVSLSLIHIYIYAIPYEYYEKYGIRRYGFHGTSHKYVAERAADILNVNIHDLKLITCHLGNGASVSAIKRGVCLDTSMGFTPLEGLVMGTRCGDIDPAIVTYIREKENLAQGEANEILNKKSGVLGISGVSSDFRDLEAAAAEGNERALLAIKVFAHKVRSYIGAYIAEMNGVDAIVFTAGVGENDISMRDIICNDMGNLGIKLDLVKNKVRGKEMIISRDDSRVKIILVPTNEELMIARDTYRLCQTHI